MLDHLPIAELTCVDDFRDLEDMTSKAGVKNVGDVFKENLSAQLRSGQVRLVQQDAESALRRMNPDHFDLVYIDASKDSRAVLEHAVLSFHLLKKGGVLVLDDYTSSEAHDGSCPKQGIDAFLDIYAPFLHVRYMGWQVIVQKRLKTLDTARAPVCHSEYFSRAHEPRASRSAVKTKSEPKTTKSEPKTSKTSKSELVNRPSKAAPAPKLSRSSNAKHVNT
jgi:SAM-dependent methyltransferase